MKTYYTSEKNIQMIISLLKAHNIKKVIASPGTTHISFLGSIQSDPYFEIYSSVDERSAAYMACGLAAESGEPVVLTCTGATASRNYVPGMTEAYYRKLPILALTATQHQGRIGQNVAQVIDRRNEINDTVKYIAQIPTIHTAEDEEAVAVELNKAMLELNHHGKGPVLINFTSTYNNDFSVKELPPVHVINRITYTDELPKLIANKVGIFVGAHLKWCNELTKEVDEFCEKYNAVVLCDSTSNYIGRYGINANLVSTYEKDCRNMDLIIDIGEISGAYYGVKTKKSWRVSPDGEIRERGLKLSYVFEMEEVDFFKKYNSLVENKKENTNYLAWKKTDEELRNKIPDLPFSNLWIAQQISNKIPTDSVIYLGILNTLRSWNFTPRQNNLVLCNTGGFGIDGNMSSALGASLTNKNKLHFLFIGDLAFFYDLNSIGNRHVGNNLRIMLINNGRGTEFRNYSHRAQMTFGDDADPFMAAGGHFGNQSKDLVKDYSTDLGFEYLSAKNKKEFNDNIGKFLNSKLTDKPILFEVFTDYKDESDALKTMCNLEFDGKKKIKGVVKKIVGENNVKNIKKILGK